MLGDEEIYTLENVTKTKQGLTKKQGFCWIFETFAGCSSAGGRGLDLVEKGSSSRKSRVSKGSKITCSITGSFPMPQRHKALR
jgi:hypothetical protein